MGEGVNVVALVVFVFFFGVVTVMGFLAARWRRAADALNLDEWGLGGRSFGTWITWFLLGGDLYTAYTFVAEAPDGTWLPHVGVEAIGVIACLVLTAWRRNLFLGLIGAVAIAGLAAAVRRDRRLPGRVLLLAAMWLPSVLLLTGALAPSAPLEGVIVAGGCALLALATERLRPWPRSLTAPAATLGSGRSPLPAVNRSTWGSPSWMMTTSITFSLIARLACSIIFCCLVRQRLLPQYPGLSVRPSQAWMPMKANSPRCSQLR